MSDTYTLNYTGDQINSLLGEVPNKQDELIIEDSEGTQLTNRSNIQVSSPLVAQDDSENEKTILEVDDSGTLDLSKVLAPGTAHSATDGSPIGTVIMYFGDTAPVGYLVMDGTEYAKADYPYLAAHLATLSTASQYEGSDADHFKVPDVLGDFPRFSGTNSHANQGSGGAVGEHQDGTAELDMFTYYDQGSTRNLYVPLPRAKGSFDMINYDSRYNTSAKQGVAAGLLLQDSSLGLHTSRPTNTSFLPCIKYC